jgi:peptidyl-prolyl cis-trans isomerase D
MLESFRKYNKFIMVFLFVLIIPSFILFGVNRYEGSGGSEAVARVDGVDITRPEWDLRHRNEVDMIRRQAPNIEPAMLDSDLARYGTLERMVRERVLAAAAAKANLTTSDERLMRLFAEDPGLAAFRTPKGEFDREAFMRVTGRTPDQYIAGVRADLATQQVLLGVSGAAFATPAQATATLDAFFDRRQIQVALFKPADFDSKVQVTDGDLQAFYKDHAERFQASEQASVEYLVLDLETVKKNITVSEAELRSYYEQNRDRFGSPEERRASHILIAVPAGAPAADREAARAKAEQLLAGIRQAPGTFAEVARKNSQDPLSAEQGGGLDFMARDVMAKKPFDDALFALEKGEISNVVETEFGYHILRLDDIRPAVVPPFEQVRATLENEVRSQQAMQEFAKAAETLTDVVYNQSDSLAPAAEKLHLAIRTAGNVARLPAPGASGALANRTVLAALFAPESLERKHTTEAIEIGANQLASGRVIQYSPARALPFEEVREQVRAQLVAERAAALARAEGAARLAAWQADLTGAVFGAPMTVSRQETQSQLPQIIDAALRADSARLPALVGADLGPQGFAVVRVIKTVPRMPSTPEVAKQESAQYAQAAGAAETTAYYEMLKNRFKAEILAPMPSESATGAER